MKTTKHFLLFTATLMLVVFSGYSDSSVVQSGETAIATEQPASPHNQDVSLFSSPLAQPFMLSEAALDCDQAETQAELNYCAAQAATAADKRLNAVYQQLRGAIQGTPQEQRLINAQLAWIEFRDRDCDYAQHQYDGGSMMPMIYGFCVADLTEKRTRELAEYLEQESF
ncbi:MAG: lysozyme inhibitor LprI family protein [Kamptonema sp. SIO4C4]|nr:lysozyme inhibitor LprI family protein [Kamptonema sp. SIO4C4]